MLSRIIGKYVRFKCSKNIRQVFCLTIISQFSHHFLLSPSILSFTCFSFISLWDMIKGWLDERTQSKIQIFGDSSTYLPALEEVIGLENLALEVFIFFNLIYFSYLLISFLSIILKKNKQTNSISQINVQSSKIQPTTSSPPSSHLAQITSHISNLYPEM